MLFLSKLMLQKKGHIYEGNEAEFLAEHTKKMSELQEKIIQLKAEPQFQGFGPFFAQVDTFLSPLYTLKDFKVALAQTLAPIYPYLEKACF